MLSIRAVRTRRFEALGFLKFVQFIAVAIVAGLLWLQRAADRDLLAAQDTAALCFFELVCTSAPAAGTVSGADVVGKGVLTAHVITALAAAADLCSWIAAVRCVDLLVCLSVSCSGPQCMHFASADPRVRLCSSSCPSASSLPRCSCSHRSCQCC